MYFPWLYSVLFFNDCTWTVFKTPHYSSSSFLISDWTWTELRMDTRNGYEYLQLHRKFCEIITYFYIYLSLLKVYLLTLKKCIKYNSFFSVTTTTLFRSLIKYLSVGSCQSEQRNKSWQNKVIQKHVVHWAQLSHFKYHGFKQVLSDSRAPVQWKWQYQKFND